MSDKSQYASPEEHYLQSIEENNEDGTGSFPAIPKNVDRKKLSVTLIEKLEALQSAAILSVESSNASLTPAFLHKAVCFVNFLGENPQSWYSREAIDEIDTAKHFISVLREAYYPG